MGSELPFNSPFGLVIVPSRELAEQIYVSISFDYIWNKLYMGVTGFECRILISKTCVRNGTVVTAVCSGCSFVLWQLMCRHLLGTVSLLVVIIFD